MHDIINILSNVEDDILKLHLCCIKVIKFTTVILNDVNDKENIYPTEAITVVKLISKRLYKLNPITLYKNLYNSCYEYSYSKERLYKHIIDDYIYFLSEVDYEDYM